VEAFLQKIFTDYVVIGSGVAGLSCAVKISSLGQVALLTKGRLPECNTSLAQGGIAAALGPGDSPELHCQDTLQAGAEACDLDAVEVLVREGPARVLELARMGVPFDTRPDGSFAYTREGAHSLPRVIPALRDATGKAIEETLTRKALEIEAIKIHEHTYALDLLIPNGRCNGILARNIKTGDLLIILARAVILATGGCGQIYQYTSNGTFCSGDGIAMAYRAGARIADLEFIQFHPTSLVADENPLPLISEAVRGEGAILVNQHGERFMKKIHPWAELAPRDVVARGIFRQMEAGNRVLLDVSPLGEAFERRFPNISEACRSHGFAPPYKLLPVTPAAHFIMGGICTDLNGCTTIKSLYACGEAARTGVHGANRLASNSLLEGLVFAHRIYQHIAAHRSKNHLYGLEGKIFEEMINKRMQNPALLKDRFGFEKGDKSLFHQLRRIMWAKAGLVRNREGLQEAVRSIKEIRKDISPGNIELQNMATIAGLVAEAALAREESRGSHTREDFPEASITWRDRHIMFEEGRRGEFFVNGKDSALRAGRRHR
jgi:L-aspartate oxidase